MAARDAAWMPDDVMADFVATQAAIATDLEAFDARITERGWTFDEDESCLLYTSPSPRDS